MSALDYVIRVHAHPSEVDAQAWNALLAQQAQPTPFLRHEYLLALHETGCAVPATGWAPQFISVHTRAGELRAATPLYLKSHSSGEYVFDWAWAEAYQRHGLRYYPKLLDASPFTPVPGSRLLAADGDARAALVAAMGQLLEDSRVSSAHALFLEAADAQAFQQAGWLMRDGVQFHWRQDAAAPAQDFTELLARMQRDKRKKIQQERRRVADQGVVFQAVEGTDIDEGLWDFFHQCYTDTYAAHGSTPYLNRDFFRRMQQDMPQHWLMFVGSRGGERVAASLVAIDRARGWAWGRYWGCVESLPCVHFEACYYQPLAWCLAQGFVCFEGGAQGEHKMARGLLPVRTVSAHRLSDPRFSNAVADFLAREGQGMAQYMDELNEHQPFKRAG
ncbi:MAG: GNAT family N-acetyltransferase [Rubrivivax sp.]